MMMRTILAALLATSLHAALAGEVARVDSPGISEVRDQPSAPTDDGLFGSVPQTVR